MGVFLRILLNFQEQLFCTTHMVAASDCFVVFFVIFLLSDIKLRQRIRTPFKSHRILTEYL